MYQLPFDVPELSYEEALGVVTGALRFGIEPLLETVEDMLAELADPDLAFECVQIAGTTARPPPRATPRRSWRARVCASPSTPRPSS